MKKGYDIPQIKQNIFVTTQKNCRSKKLHDMLFEIIRWKFYKRLYFKI